MTHIYHTVPSVQLTGKVEICPDARKDLRKLSKKWPDAKFAAAQCVDLSSRNIGSVTFCAVGPSNTIKTVDSQTLVHWSMRFVGFVNLDTWKIEPAAI